eukprot:TRINITY_DN11683_c0_g1_i1.p1 TRINITY_DN11683_c0_g1~~TRINITY_DN11683_c0_g1_i1.p1  ORF type:complete len:1066 (+),score=258.88 TRINITY_DN11683_c0_g1_i1:89-3199(+)
MKHPTAYLLCLMGRFCFSIGPLMLIGCAEHSRAPPLYHRDCDLHWPFDQGRFLYSMVPLTVCAAAAQGGAQLNTYKNRNKLGTLGQGVPIWRSATFALTTVTAMISFGVTTASNLWFGLFLGFSFLTMQVGSALASFGPRNVTREYVIGTGTRFSGMLDVMTDWSVLGLLGLHHSLGPGYLVYASANALLLFVSLSTTVLRSSIPRVVGHVFKAVFVDLPMLVADIYLLQTNLTGHCSDGDCGDRIAAVIVLSLTLRVAEVLLSVTSLIKVMELFKEHNGMQATIKVCEEVTADMGRMNLEKAKAHIDGGIPNQALQTALTRLIEVLEGFRPFLPEGIIPIDSDDEGSEPTDNSRDAASRDFALLTQASPGSHPTDAAPSPPEPHAIIPVCGEVPTCVSDEKRQETLARTTESSHGSGASTDRRSMQLQRGLSAGVSALSPDMATFSPTAGRARAMAAGSGPRQTRSRHASVLSVEFSGGSGAQFKLQSELQVALGVCKSVRGCVTAFSAEALLCAWNTHYTCYTYATSACRAASHRGMQGHRRAVCSGPIEHGLCGNDQLKSPFISGPCVRLAVALTGLCPLVDANCLADEAVKSLVHEGSFVMWPVDVVPEDPRDPGGASTIVFSLCEAGACVASTPTSEVFSLLRRGKVQAAKDLATRTPDVGERLAAILSVVEPDTPYLRAYHGWMAMPGDALWKSRRRSTLILRDDAVAMDDPAAAIQEKLDAIREALQSQLPPSAAGSSETGGMEFCDTAGTHWRLSEKVLGKGAFGEVVLGMSKRDGLLAAVKIVRLPNKPQPKPGRRNRGNGPSGREVADLITEIKLLAGLHHEHIVAYFGAAFDETRCMLVMEYVSGGSLETICEKFGALPAPTARRYMKYILRGLIFLHKNDIVHRDFKPGNVLLMCDGVCKLADFGASTKQLQQTVGSKEEVVGTPLYMAPEACRGKAEAASDIWGVGITLIQMLSGKLPYEVDSSFIPSVFIFKLRDGQVQPVIPQVLLDGPAAQVEFIGEALCLEPSARPTASNLLMHPFLTG